MGPFFLPYRTRPIFNFGAPQRVLELKNRNSDAKDAYGSVIVRSLLRTAFASATRGKYGQSGWLSEVFSAAGTRERSSIGRTLDRKMFLCEITVVEIVTYGIAGVAVSLGERAPQ